MTRPGPIATARLVIRPFVETDAGALCRGAGAFEVADMTLRIPHPYKIEDAYKWLAGLPEGYESGKSFPMAIEHGSELIGAVGLDVEAAHSRAELGYWIDVGHWGQGYATEASAAMLRFGFETLGINRVTAHHYTRNPASGRVLEKIGMKREGVLRQHTRKWDRFEDLVIFAMLRSEWTPPAGPD